MNIIPPKFKAKLDPYQFVAATTGNGPKRCNASAGSGKTTTYAHRVVFLVANGVKEENIMATTFTKKAAKEMEERILRVAADNGVVVDTSKMWIGTFHSLGIRACREYSHIVGYRDNFTFDNDDQQVYAVKKILMAHPTFKGMKHLKPFDVLSAISYARNAGLDYLPVFEKKIRNISAHAALVDVAIEYEKQKRDRNVFDFDDMLVYWLEILTKSHHARNFYQDKLHYILVDEYQDTNYIQNEIVDILAGGHRNLFVVGDDYQSIYGFRAAEVRNIIDFDKRYPDCETFNLENNYRSTPEIVAIASDSIARNKNQLKKQVKTPNKSGNKPLLLSPRDESTQNQNIVRMIQVMASKGVPYKNIAVLYKNNSMSVLLEKDLNSNLIPYVKKGGQFWKQAHLVTALSWINLVQNPGDTANIMRCAEIFKGIGKAALTELIEKVYDEKTYNDFVSGDLVINPKKPQMYEEFRSHIHKLEDILAENETPVKDAVKHIVTEIMTPYTIQNWDDGHERADDFGVLIDLADEFETITDLLEAIAMQEENSKKKKEANAVTLSTGHGAKGLEWDVVFLIGLVDEFFPSKYSFTEADREEERRLFYVMLTRAKKRLYMFAPERIKHYGETKTVGPSMFLLELDPDLYDQKTL